MTLSLEELIATAQPRTREVRVCARGDLVDRHAQLVDELDEASDSLGAPKRAKEIAAEILAVEEEQEEYTLVVTLASVSRRVWADLLAEHAPRKEDREKGLDYHPVTFPPAAVAACAKEPALTYDTADRLASTLPAGEWNKLWLTAVELNVMGTPHPKFRAAAEIAQLSVDS